MSKLGNIYVLVIVLVSHSCNVEYVLFLGTNSALKLSCNTSTIVEILLNELMFLIHFTKNHKFLYFDAELT